MRLLLIAAAATLAAVSVAHSVGSTSEATGTSLNHPTAAAPIPAAQGGGFYIADAANHVVRKVDTGGHITIVAGNGTAGGTGDGGPATSAELDAPTDALPTSDGGILIADSGITFFGGTGVGRVRKVSSTGIITTVAGGPANCGPPLPDRGDGCPATQAFLAQPTSAVPLSGGGFLISDYNDNRVRKVDATGHISTVAGGGTPCVAKTDDQGDGCPATQAYLSGPTATIPFNIDGAAVPTSGSGFLVAEEQNCRVRYVDGGGTITTVAGTGTCHSLGDPDVPSSGDALTTEFDPIDARPTATAGVFLLADGINCAIRRVDTATHQYTTISTDADCKAHQGAAFGTTAAIPAVGGGFLVADNNAAKVAAATAAGVLTTVAGSGVPSQNLTLPRITGTPAVGSTLSCSSGTWKNSPASYSYAWNRDGTAIPGAVAATYPVVAADAGHAITCTVTAHGSPVANATSAPVSIPAKSVPPPPPPALKPAKCTFTKRSATVVVSPPRKAKKGSRKKPAPTKVLAFSFKCNQAAKVTYKGVVKETIKSRKKHAKPTTKSVSLGSHTISVKASKSVAVTLKLPAGAITALKSGTKESAVLTLAAKNANGTGRATSTLPRLKAKR